MKKIYALTLLAVLLCTAVVAQDKGVFELKYPTYLVTAPVQMNNLPDANLVPLIAAKNDSLTKKSASHRFGILYRDDVKALSKTMVLQLLDAETNQPIKEISLDEYFGKENSGWKFNQDESKSTSAKSTSVFSVTAGSRKFEFIREVELKDDQNLPLGKEVIVSLAMKSDNPMKVKVKFLGKAEGTFKPEKNAFTIASDDNSAGVNPVLVYQVSPSSRVRVGAAARKGTPQPFTVETDEVNVEPQQQTTILSFTVAGSTIRSNKHVSTQARNIAAYLATRVSKPAMVSVTQTDKPTTSPGDTLTYVIVYHNVGTGAAADISIENPIPKGSKYIENSAEGLSCAISLTKGAATSAGAGSVEKVTWKFRDPIFPGEEREVKFKVLIL